jgi:hypothetical protein
MVIIYGRHGSFVVERGRFLANTAYCLFGRRQHKHHVSAPTQDLPSQRRASGYLAGDNECVALQFPSIFDFIHLANERTNAYIRQHIPRCRFGLRADKFNPLVSFIVTSLVCEVIFVSAASWECVFDLTVVTSEGGLGLQPAVRLA